MAETEILVRYATIPRWCTISSMGRTTTYREVAAGNLRLIKIGRRSLIDVRAGLAWLESLPSAQSRTAPRREAA